MLAFGGLALGGLAETFGAGRRLLWRLVRAAGVAARDDLLGRVGCQVLGLGGGAADAAAAVAAGEVMGDLGAGPGGCRSHDLLAEARGCHVVDVGLGGVGVSDRYELASAAGAVGEFVQGRLVEVGAGGLSEVPAAGDGVPDASGCGGRQSTTVGGAVAGSGGAEHPRPDAFAAGGLGCSRRQAGCAARGPSGAANGPSGGPGGGSSALGWHELGRGGSSCQPADGAADETAGRAGRESRSRARAASASGGGCFAAEGRRYFGGGLGDELAEPPPGEGHEGEDGEALKEGEVVTVAGYGGHHDYDEAQSQHPGGEPDHAAQQHRHPAGGYGAASRERHRHSDDGERRERGGQEQLGGEPDEGGGQDQ